MMDYISYYIYRTGEDARIGLIFKPTPNLSLDELDRLLDELRDIRAEFYLRTQTQKKPA